MATWYDVRRISLALPETTERDRDRSWRVRDKGFAWERRSSCGWAPSASRT